MDSAATMTSTCSVAQLLVRNLEAQGVEHVFGIPGAKIDLVFEELSNSKIKTVVCRHEQNAAFMAGAVGRLTGKAGVVLATSGPGCSNLVTGLATANTEGDPVVAFGGAVAVSQQLKRAHQSMDTVNLLRPVTKFSAEVSNANTVSEVFAQAFRCAESDRPGAAFVSLPSDVMTLQTDATILAPVRPCLLGKADQQSIELAARHINASKSPVLLLGMSASQHGNALAIRELLRKAPFAVASCYQAAGVISRDLLHCFAGRVGIFHNQPADSVLDNADLVITVGFNPVEYDPVVWNHKQQRKLIHIDTEPADADADYQPLVELIGSIAATLDELVKHLSPVSAPSSVSGILAERTALAEAAGTRCGFPVHPLRIVHELQDVLTDDITLCVDIGSFYIWISRYLYSYKARQILTSNGQQTLGVALPWAIAASLLRPSQKVISVSGDGGFLFSGMELETAVRLRCNIVHLIWIDGTYNMVQFQELAKYGRDAAVHFGGFDVVRYAESFGAAGFSITSADELRPTLRKAMEIEGPVLIGIPVDYSDNLALLAQVRANVVN